MPTPPEIPKGTKVIERKRVSGDTEYVVRRDPNYGKDDCWIATAYFGDPYHPDVKTLRAARNYYTASGWFRPLVRGCNRLYYAIGRTKPARWWRSGLTVKGSTTRQILTGLFLKPLIAVARTLNCKNALQ